MDANNSTPKLKQKSGNNSYNKANKKKQTVQPKGSNPCVSTDYNTLPVESE